MYKLVRPSVKYKTSYLKALEEAQAEGRERDKKISDLKKDFSGFIKKLNDQARGLNLPKGFVPDTRYWMANGTRYIGDVSMRHWLNKNLRNIGGHIGYSIRPSQRRKGLGTLQLKLALPKAKKLGLKKVLLTCDSTNIGSRKIIEANGGKFAGEVEQGGGLPTKLRFWITIS